MKKEILDEEEKEYLHAVIKPFKNRINYIQKRSVTGCDQEFIEIALFHDTTYLPYFQKDTMYKGMKVDKEYTLKELGLE